MNNVNIMLYSLALKINPAQTEELLLCMLRHIKQVLLKRTNILSLTPLGFQVLGLKYEHYRSIWECDREETIDQPEHRELVKRMHVELEQVVVPEDALLQEQLSYLKSMNSQDMIRAGLWTRQPLSHEPQEEVEDDF